MTRTFAKTLVTLGLVSGAAVALGQGPGWSICIDPTNTMPYSPDFLSYSLSNGLFIVSAGISGTVTYGGQNAPCWTVATHTYNTAGRIGFGSGGTGSSQSTFDDDLMYTVGMPNEPAGPWSYANTVRIDPTDVNQVLHFALIGEPTGTAFIGASGRYFYFDKTGDGIFTQIRCDQVGDAVRIRWVMTNNNTTAQELGLWYGADMGILQSGAVPNPGTDSGLLGGPVFIRLPGRKPVLVDTQYIRSLDPANFPPYAQLVFGQTNAYGLQVDLGPTDATSDINHQNSDATIVDEFEIGHDLQLRGNPITGNSITQPPDVIFGDTLVDFDPAFTMKYYPQAGGAIQPGGTRVIVSYFRDVWGNSKYTRPSPTPQRPSDQPYTTVVDAPHLLVQDDGGGTNGLGNNPFTIVAYVDNVGGYTDINTSVQLNDVVVTLNLPAGLTLINGDVAEKIITQVNPLQVASVSWQVQSDGIVVGDLPYSVTISSTPGPPHPIEHDGGIRISATKQIPLQPAANLITTPWVFADTSWEVVLGLTTPNDFTAYEWDPLQNSYIVSTSARRGVGYWILLNPATHPFAEVVPYVGATTPPDILSGAPNQVLHGGWNLIGDPYPYAIPISELVGVSASNPAQSFSFADLIAQNVVSPYLAYWDTTVGNYRYSQGITALMQPNQGLWINVQTAQDLVLNFPPVNDTFVPGGRSVGEPGWVQTPSHWRLQFQARSSNGGQDNQNFVGVAAGYEARTLQIPKPPEGPGQDVIVLVDGANANRPGQFAQVIANHTGTLSWNVQVKTKRAGSVTVNWPNMSTLPTNLSFRLVDPVTHVSVDMRSRTSVTFPAGANGTKQMQIQSSVASSGLSSIGTITPAPGKLANAFRPVTVNFTLNYAATVTVRILNSQGNEVAVIRNNEQLAKGNNTALWQLRNASGALVPAGTYKVEVNATVNGQASQKVASVVVQR